MSAIHALLRRLEGGRKIRKLNLVVSADIDGKTMRIPIVQGVGIVHLHPSEAWLSRLLHALKDVFPGPFLDVGVNIGQTLLKVRSTDPRWAYFGFEPNPACCWYTRQLIQANGFERCTLVPIGLGERPGLLTLHAADALDVSASVVEGFRSAQRYSEAQHVAIFRGDDVLGQLGVEEVGILKVDVEGGELEVLRGLSGTIHRARPLVVCEILPVFAPGTERGRFRQARQDALLALMAAESCRMYRLMEDGPPVPLDRIEPHEDMRLTNYAFVPEERAAAFESALGVARPASSPSPIRGSTNPNPAREPVLSR